MPKWGSAKRTDRGFTLLEFLALVAGLTLLTALGLPRLMGPRMEFNQACAVELLQMIRDARTAWWEREGRYPSLLELCAREGPVPGRPRALIPSGFQLAQKGAALRAGYLFFEVPEGTSAPTGCRAMPKFAGYSGRQQFQLDYANGKISPWQVPD